MQKLHVELKEIKCNKTQDPKYDELYFITAVDGQVHDSDTIRRIEEGKTETEFEKDEKLLFNGNVDEDAPIIVTVMEQRAVKDRSKLQEKIKELAEKGVEKAKEEIIKQVDSKEDAYKVVITFVVEKLVELVEKLFKDETLGHEVISPDEKGEKKINLKKDDFDYEITLSITRD